MNNTMLVTPRLVLREVEAADVDIVTDYFHRNAARFEPWFAPPRGAQDCRWWIDLYRHQSANGSGRAFLTFAGEALVAVVDLFAIAPDSSSAMIGYSLDAAQEGKGIASEAVAAVMRYAFEELRIGELAAHYHPRNERSAKLLQRAGFSVALVAQEVPEEVRAFAQPEVRAVRRA